MVILLIDATCVLTVSKVTICVPTFENTAGNKRDKAAVLLEGICNGVWKGDRK